MGSDSLGKNSKYIEIVNLRHFYPIKRGIFRRVVGHVKAVNDVSFDIRGGETLGLVGESGCGKTTVGRAILRLIKPTAGEVRFKGVDVGVLQERDNTALRRGMQIIFQDPYGSLNPRMTVEDIIGEAPRYHGIVPRGELAGYVGEIMEKVGLRPESRTKYPHEFSGGQRQRIGIARVLAMKPEFVVCDEPVSALDVSIQSQVLNLLADLRSEFSLTYLFISHDLSVVRHISDRVAVLYLGRMVEIAPKESFFERPMHPYSQALISAIPSPSPDTPKNRIMLEGDVPSPINPPDGCIFSTRCPKAMPRCASESPHLAERTGSGDGHMVACFLYE
ncbi:MAG: ATP-binding cassette domain-containing protein [Synergistaceae bacterium]|jgi:oligopeptide/dipeptide ABC transporter ATP-binding protein|nr:ATP-binding cassette domain-containing protein [Synergistaceae bacterium]